MVPNVHTYLIACCPAEVEYEGGWSVNESPYGQMQSISPSKSLGGEKGTKANCPSVGFSKL